MKDKKTWECIEEIGDNHFTKSIETPLKKDAFEMDDAEKITRIADNFEEIMDLLGLDMTDDSLKGTPLRVAKMYVKEVFHGLNPANKPSVTLFDNKYQYEEMLIEKNIGVNSFCEHHFVPIIGKAHIAYFSSGKVIGLSKLNRIVDYFSRRPQVQERLTVQIASELKEALQTEDVAVIIDAKHLCVSQRGIKDHESSTLTASYHGKFKLDNCKQEFLSLLES